MRAGRTLAFNGVCGNLGVSLAAGISAALATWFSWRAAFFAPAAILVATGIFYLWVTPDDRHHVNKRQSKPAVPLRRALPSCCSDCSSLSHSVRASSSTC